MRGQLKNRVCVVLLLAGAAWICLQLGLKVQRIMCSDVYLMSFLQADTVFSSSDLEKIEREGIDLTYTQRMNVEVSNGFRKEEINVYATNENYAYFTETFIVNGAFFNQMQVSRKMTVLAVNENAAYQLFGTDQCVGEIVYLNRVPYQIIGIMAEQGTEDARIYIPGSTMELLNNSVLEVEQIWCRFANLANAALVMTKVGYPLNVLNVVQIDLVKGVFLQRFFLLFILTGAYIVVGICKSIKKKSREFLKESYSTRKRVGAGIFLQMVGAGAGIYVLWKLTEIAWCVPPNYVLLGGDWKAALCGLLDFYLLANLELHNMTFLTYWNLLSIIFMVFYFFSIYIILSGRYTHSISK